MQPRPGLAEGGDRFDREHLMALRGEPGGIAAGPRPQIDGATRLARQETGERGVEFVR